MVGVAWAGRPNSILLGTNQRSKSIILGKAPKSAPMTKKLAKKRQPPKQKLAKKKPPDEIEELEPALSQHDLLKFFMMTWFTLFVAFSYFI